MERIKLTPKDIQPNIHRPRSLAALDRGERQIIPERDCNEVYNYSFERAGFAHIMAELSAAGGDAVILVDCPVEALPDYATDLQHKIGRAHV